MLSPHIPLLSNLSAPSCCCGDMLHSYMLQAHSFCITSVLFCSAAKENDLYKGPVGVGNF